jgi:hypothetical protein
VLAGFLPGSLHIVPPHGFGAAVWYVKSSRFGTVMHVDGIEKPHRYGAAHSGIRILRWNDQTCHLSG